MENETTKGEKVSKKKKIELELEKIKERQKLLEQQRKEIVKAESAKDRKLRARMLIELGAFLFEDLGDFALELRIRHLEFGFLGAGGIAQPGQKVCDGIVHVFMFPQAAASATLATAFLALSAKGIPSSLRRDLASSLVWAVVTIVTSKPMFFLMRSSSISGKID